MQTVKPRPQSVPSWCRAIHFIQAILFIVSVLTAFLLRFELSIPQSEWQQLWTASVTAVVAKTAAFWFLHVNRGWWKYVSSYDLFRLGAANLLGSGFVVIICSTTLRSFPRSVYVGDFVVCCLLTGAVRLSGRVISEYMTARERTHVRTRCLIYGAGDAGFALLREIRHNKALPYHVCGFLDDDTSKVGMRIGDTKVLGNGSTLGVMVRKYDVSLVLIAMPSASGGQITKVLEVCIGAGVTSQTIPGFADRLNAKELAHQIRDVAVEDLLNRAPVGLEQDRIADKLRNRTILVTGAAGSIGSELCRQISVFHPATVVAFDIAETPLFQLGREMARIFPEVAFYTEIGSVQNQLRLCEVLDRFNPSIIYHAAAYKHVPLMESHVWEAIENNVFGTLNLALIAARHGVEDFVMISSDKAVRPTNMMGVSKRLAELVIRSLQNPGSKYVSVRFGNVLGSNGSVVPIFKDQIARGGPVTVTHPEMKRYFMTIPEACQLVLQSSTMGEGGEIFVLDMGKPVRIVDLARNLILLSGLIPNRDIQIQFSGIRPGEKLSEELNTDDEHIMPTYHSHIKMFSGPTISWTEMEAVLDRLQRASSDRDLDELLLIIKRVIPEYNPSFELLSRVLSKPSASVQNPRLKARHATIA